MKLGPVIQEEMSFKEKVYGHTTDKDQSQWLTLSHRSGELKITHLCSVRLLNIRGCCMIHTMYVIIQRVSVSPMSKEPLWWLETSRKESYETNNEAYRIQF